MKVIIAGSRHMPLSGYHLISKAIKKSGFNVTEVVSGCARGADTLGEMWADENTVPCSRFPADWDTYKKAAGPIRNAQMKEYADALIVFIWDGSRGSQNMYNQMVKAGKPAFAVYNGQV